jgi:hypothetical protein
MVLRPILSIWLAAAIGLSNLALGSARADESEKDRVALAADLKDAKVTLEEGLKASEREGKPIWAKFEVEDGKLQLSIYTMKPDGFAEVVIDPKTGTGTKSEKITDAEDLKAATTQKAAVEKASTSLLAAAEKAAKTHAGYRSVSIVPEMKGGHPMAEVTLLQGGTFKKVAEKLD